MMLADLDMSEKLQLFKFIAHLAILAGQEMSPEGYAGYNEVVYEFLYRSDLFDDFEATAREAGLTSGRGSC